MVRFRRAGLVGRKLTTGLSLVVLLLAAGGAGLVAAVSGDASGLASAGEAVAVSVTGNGSNWLRIRMNLSGSSDLTSGYPDVAIDSSGNYVAVVWTEGYNSSEGAKHQGRVYLRWTSENIGLWSPKITVDDGTNDANDWAREAAIALHRDVGSGMVTAHVVWVRFEKLYGWRLKHRACVLGGACGSVATLLASSYSEDSPFFVPDIAADSSGRLFVAWVHKYWDFVSETWQQAIEYRQFNVDGSGWSPPLNSGPTEIGSKMGNDWPTVAVRGDTVYAAWIQEQSGIYRVRCGKKTISGYWDFDDVYPSNKELRNPFLAADDEAIYLAWGAFFGDSDFGLGKDDYSIRYKSDTGSGWPSEFEAITNTQSLYTAMPSGEEYLQVLRPALALGSEGALHAAWHHNYYVPPANIGDPTIDTYRVLYSSSVSPTASLPTWSEPVVLATLSADGRPFLQDNVAPRIAVGGSAAEPHVHVVIMLRTGAAWDVWYLSNQTYNSALLPIVPKNG